MCEIQFILGKDLSEHTVEEFLYMLETGSYGNNDATGIFGENGVFLKWPKALYEFDHDKVRDIWAKLVNSKTRWLVGHNRLATQGSEALKKNNHPFRNEVCTVVHNGVLSNDDALKSEHKLQYKEQTDSAIIPHLIDHYFDAKVDELEAIKLAMEEITGSYSVFIHMNASDNLYYLKNSSTNFSFMRAETTDGVCIYGSTRKESLKSIGTQLTNGAFQVDSLMNRSLFEPSSGEIYKIDIQELSIEKVETFKPRTLTSITYYGNQQFGGAYGNYSNANDYDTKSYNTASSGVLSNRQQKRDAKKDVREFLRDTDSDIGEIWNEFLDEFDYASGLYLDNDNIDAKLQETDVKFNMASQTIVLTNVPEALAEQLETYADGRIWGTTDRATKGLVNLTLTFQSVIDFVESNSGVRDLNTEIKV